MTLDPGIVVNLQMVENNLNNRVIDVQRTIAVAQLIGTTDDWPSLK